MAESIEDGEQADPQLDDDRVSAFLAAEAEFSPMFARHYVFDRDEAERFAALIGVEATEQFQQEMHITLAMFAETVARPSMPLDKAVRHVMETVSKGDFLALDGLRDDSARNAAIVSLQSLLPPDIEFSRAPAAMKKIADDVLTSTPRGRRGGPTVDFH
jgi:hypothetical protein